MDLASFGELESYASTSYLNSREPWERRTELAVFVLGRTLEIVYRKSASVLPYTKYEVLFAYTEHIAQRACVLIPS